MALTDHERQELHSLELRLSAEDARFADRFQRAQQSLDFSGTVPRIPGGAMLVLVGLVILTLGAFAGLGLVGAGGFFIMMTGVVTLPGVLSFPNQRGATSRDR